MQLHTREHDELIERFERDIKHLPGRYRTDKESRDLWPKGYVYQHGETNHAFLAYRLGYAAGRAIGAQS